ncbi:hypothetical protein HELRODRAFT_189336 [Helobdella robusta]|uniref:DH domain-containing protein n=1 Tax=Helobdella robusta TaxID=6412 RepID=T1FQZ2_HELRO|nr:hypothetical protein HELRODRAFT_189336 [Helobdella robusta]ESN96695.1 hypothetical protein HELRODRAFT_189336 [Helobdella robusta]
MYNNYANKNTIKVNNDNDNNINGDDDDDDNDDDLECYMRSLGRFLVSYRDVSGGVRKRIKDGERRNDDDDDIYGDYDDDDDGGGGKRKNSVGKKNSTKKVEKPPAKLFPPTTRSTTSTLKKSQKPPHLPLSPPTTTPPLMFPTWTCFRTRDIFREFLKTEQHYNRSLKCVVSNFRQPVLLSLESNRAFTSWQNAKLLFDDVNNIYHISCCFLKELEAQNSHTQSTNYLLGECFTRVSNDIQQVYSSYLLSYPSILNVYDKVVRQSVLFRLFLRKVEFTASSMMSSLPDLYMKPWKRVHEYINLLTAYRNLLSADHVDARNVLIGLKFMKALKKSIMETQKRLESDGKMDALQDTIVQSPLLKEPGRRYVAELHCICYLVVDTNSCVPEFKVPMAKDDLSFFLFNDCMVCCQRVATHVPFKSNITNKYIFVQTCSLQYLRVSNLMDTAYMRNAFKMWTPKNQWLCSVDDNLTKHQWVSTLERTVKKILKKH